MNKNLFLNRERWVGREGVEKGGGAGQKREGGCERKRGEREREVVV